MTPHERQQSIGFEPHLAGFAPEKGLPEPVAPLEPISDNEAVEHTVWDEPTLASELTDELSADRLTYRKWLAENIHRTSWATSWNVVLLLILVAGPWGILGAFFGGGEAGGLGTMGLLAVVVIGPVTEEITKIAATLWVVEKRPFWFKSFWQILICSAAGGLLFGLIENLIYLHIYIPGASKELSNWRWSVCTGLHVNCSFAAGVGLVRIWDNSIRNLHRPQLGLGYPWFLIAMVGHGLYNGSVTIAEIYGWLDF